jgi:ATP-dependent Clp protease ATP-binding subunit ClpA
MEFLVWHYSAGFKYYVEVWFSYLDWVAHSFSLPLLISSLFAPWKRLLVEDKSPGFNLSRWLTNLSFNLISRGIGAVTRLILMAAGIFLLALVFIFGTVGLFFWAGLPLLGLPTYIKYKRQPEISVKDLMAKLNLRGVDPATVIFGSNAGHFVLAHTGLTLDGVTSAAKTDNLKIIYLKPKCFADVMQFLVDAKIFPRDFFYQKQIIAEDLVLAGAWWDEKMRDENEITTSQPGSAGIARELLFGYTPTLNKYAIDLSIPQAFASHLIGRSDTVSRMERVLSARGSVCLVGSPGVGKKTTVLEFARRAYVGEFGIKMAYKKVVEFDYNALLSESGDLNRKKTMLGEILTEAEEAGNIILMIRDIHRLTNSDVEGYDFTEVFEEHMEKGNLAIIAIETPADYERFIAPNLRLKKYLEKVEIAPISKNEAREVLIEAAQALERKTGILIMVNSLRHVLDMSETYITETPYPEKAIELLDAVIEFARQKNLSLINIENVDMVLSEKTGISLGRLTHEEEQKLGNLEEIIHERLVDQEVAVTAIAKALRAKMVGVTKEARPLGSFLFLGPTGVGKTETAKTLAKVYYGSEEAIIRFDMAEFIGTSGLERLIGSQARNQPGALTAAIKNHPASLLLLDEIEKATPEIFNLFLTLLDEGYMTDAFGKKISGKHLFIIGTSNAGANYIRKLVTGKVAAGELQTKVIDYVMEQGYFSPEFINRFDGVIVYEPLGEEELVEVAKHQLADLAANLQDKNITLTVTDAVAAKLAKDGYQPEFGARPMKRIVNLVLGDLISRAILSGQVRAGDAIKITPGKAKDEYTLLKGETS